jgi:hypothetical protein
MSSAISLFANTPPMGDHGLAPARRRDLLDLVEFLHPALHLGGVRGARLEGLDELDLLSGHRLLALELRLLLLFGERSAAARRIRNCRDSWSATRVAALKMKHIVVLGHARCGSVRAFAKDAEPLSPGDFIGNWMELMAPVLARVGPRGDLPPEYWLARLEQASVDNSLANLMTFPRLRRMIERGDVTVPISASPRASSPCAIRRGALRAGRRRRACARVRDTAVLSTSVFAYWRGHCPDPRLRRKAAR